MELFFKALLIFLFVFVGEYILFTSDWYFQKQHEFWNIRQYYCRRLIDAYIAFLTKVEPKAKNAKKS
jgi:hypothetical protein